MVSLQRSVAIVAVGAVVLTAGVVGALVATGSSPVTAQQSTPQQTSPGGCDYASLYEDTNDAVVSVSRGSGVGSGFVHSAADGNASYVVTNAHVVGDASTVSVQFAGEETREGRVVGRDRLTDLAVVRVPETPGYVQPLDVATSQPAHGQAVAALGNPFGLEETITHGIVSGRNRSMPTQYGFAIPATIQTDAPISPGNSGGPLVTCDGTVVGVNSAGITAQGAENIGFAVSASIVQEVVPELIDDGEFAHPYLGVRIAPVTPAVAEANDLAEPRGVLIRSVESDLPAADVLQGSTETAVVDGQRVPVGGDVILAVNGTPVDSPESLSSALLTEATPGETVSVTIRRDGERMTVDVPVVERPQPQVSGPGQPAGG